MNTKKATVRKKVIQNKKAIQKEAEVRLEGSNALPLFDKNLIPDPSLKTLMADIVQTVNRTDGFTQLSFYSRVPGVNLECARVVVPTNTMRAVVENFCNATGFIPNVPQ